MKGKEGGGKEGERDIGGERERRKRGIDFFIIFQGKESIYWFICLESNQTSPERRTDRALHIQVSLDLFLVFSAFLLFKHTLCSEVK